MKLVAPALYLLITSFSAGVPNTGGAQAIPSALPVKVLSQSPADSTTNLQIICLFRSSPQNTLHGSLIEIDDKLHGTLHEIRTPALFSGELGETVLITPPPGTLAAKRLLIVGLGDSQTFTPERMRLVGKVAFIEADRLGVAHPFFAPTILDGGVTGFTTDRVSYQAVLGFLDGLATEQMLQREGAAPVSTVVDFTFLAGLKHAPATRAGVDKALGKAAANNPNE